MQILCMPGLLEHFQTREQLKGSSNVCCLRRTTANRRKWEICEIWSPAGLWAGIQVKNTKKWERKKKKEEKAEKNQMGKKSSELLQCFFSEKSLQSFTSQFYIFCWQNQVKYTQPLPNLNYGKICLWYRQKITNYTKSWIGLVCDWWDYGWLSSFLFLFVLSNCLQ